MKETTDEIDIFGLAVNTYFKTGDHTPIKVHVAGFDTDEIPVSYLFRNYQEMPKIEQIALSHAKGKIIDVGCCAGAHALILQEKNHEVLGIDTSESCINICKKRGLKHAKTIDFYDLPKSEYDCVLLMMNGIGIAKTIKGLNRFFTQLKQILNNNGYVLLDSTDLNYLFDANEFEHYYGEITYQISYKNLMAPKFKWLYIGKELLKEHALKNRFRTEILHEEENSYLAKLTLIIS